MKNVGSTFLLWTLPALALVATGCGALSNHGSTSTNSPPSGLVYSQNPALYHVGQAITQNVLTGNGLKTDAKFQISPALPAGLSFDSTTGSITGTPTTITAQADYAVGASNGYGTTYVHLLLTVGDVAPTISGAGGPYTFTVGTAIAPISPILGGGTTVSCTVSPALPSGLSLSSHCGISGTPSVAAAATTYTLTAINTGGSASTTVQITVNDIAPVISYSGSPFVYYRGVSNTAITPTSSGGAITACSSSPTLPSGVSLSSACVVSGTPSALSSSATYTITATSLGGATGTTTFQLSVQDKLPSLSYAGSPYSWTVNPSTVDTAMPTNSGGVIVSCTISPALPSGLALDATTCVISGKPTAVTSPTVYTVQATNNAGTASNNVTIGTPDLPPKIGTYSPSSYTLNRGFAASISAPSVTGGAATVCTISPGLPSGLSLSSPSCLISGTPSVTSAAQTYTVTVSNTGGSSSASLSIQVVDQAPTLSYSGSPYLFSKNIAISPSVTPTNTGSPITSCSSSPALPAGITLSSACVISGTPSVAAAGASYTITATNAGGSAQDTIAITVQDVPNITYSQSPFNLTVNTAMLTANPTNTGGAITSCAISPALPTGLSIDTTNCAISGTPTAISAAANYTVTATNAAGNGTTIITLQVNDAPPAISYSPATYTFTKGTAISAITVTNGGGAITSCVSSPTLPSGLTLSATCGITGTPTAISAAANYTVTASNSGGSSSAVLNLTVNDVIPNLSYSGSPYTFVAGSAITPVTPANSGGTVVSCSVSPALPSGLALSSTCGISGTPSAVSAATTYTISATNSGGTQNVAISISVNAAPSISYSGSPFNFAKGSAITSQTPANSGGTPTSCSSSPSLPTGLSLSTTCVLSGTPTAASSATNYTITATNSVGSGSTVINITVTAAPNINYLPSSYSFTYTKGTAIANLTPNNTGGAITSCAISPTAPAGLSFSTATCTLSGTPTAIQGATSYTVTATNAGGSSSATITITVNDVAPTLAYSGSPFAYTKGSAITTLTPTNTGGAIVSCSSSPGLPNGLTLSSACVISGTPTAVTASQSYTITGTNSGGSASATITIAVNDIAPAISYSGSPFLYTNGTAISTLTPSSTGGTVTSCSSSPTLPSGLSLSSTCVISGTPNAVSSNTSYTITATNSGGSANATIQIQVQDSVPAFSYSGPYIFTKGTAISTVNPTNTGGTITSCSASPAIPSGLTLNSNCSISGTPNAVSSATTYTITGTNATGSSTATVQLTVNDAAPAIAYSPGSVTYVLRETISSATPTNSGGTPTSCSASPSLPSGLSLSNACVISGAPTVTSSATSYTITGTNTGGSASTTITITVKNQPQIVFRSYTDLSGSSNGTASASMNVWKVSLDGVDRTALTQNTGSGLDSYGASFSADGSNLVFTSKTALAGGWNGAGEGSFNIWKMASGGTGVTALQSNSGLNYDSLNDASFSPNGTKIVFSSLTDVTGTTNGTAAAAYNLWIMNADGSGKLALTKNAVTANANSEYPVFSPDGTTIYFMSKMALTTTTSSWDQAVANCYNIWKVNPDGTGLVALTSNNTSGLDSEYPEPSPDGTEIVFQSKMKISGATPTYFNIWQMTSGGLSQTALTTNTSGSQDSEYPRYSPDGTEIVFESMMDVNAAAASSYNIWKMSSTGSSQVPLTKNNAASLDSTLPAFSPDNLYIAFVSLMNIGSNASSATNIWVMKADGTGTPTALTTNYSSSSYSSSLDYRNVWYQP